MITGTIEKAAEFLKNSGNCYILIHRNPDGDCIGCGYALKRYFNKTGRKAKVICNDEIPKKFSFIVDDDCEDFEPENIMSVDVADKKLFGEKVENNYGNIVDFSIDHHEMRKEFSKDCYVVSDASAAAEVLIDVFEELNYKIDRFTAICLYTGIATDTGCFKFSNVTWKTMEAVSKIMKEFPDINYADINRRMFTIKTHAQMSLETEAAKTLKTYFDGKVAIVTVSKKTLSDTGATENDAEAISNMSLALETVKLGITLKERESGIYKISMRGTDDCKVNCADVCAILGGGGHAKAAGCQLSGSYDEVISKIMEAVKEGADLSPVE